MSRSRRTFLQGATAVVGAAALPSCGPVAVPAAEGVGKAPGVPASPIGRMLTYFSETPPPGWVFLDGRTLMARDFPALAAIVGCDENGTIELANYDGREAARPRGRRFRWIVRVA